ncbi:hypothetical protein [Sinomonas sp. P10A9]|uniref:Uncharacterized protein n=1 Tax=Sinomonas puerhi TaxID=3238584 RepID=A0AB39L108_9MICC
MGFIDNTPKDGTTNTQEVAIALDRAGFGSASPIQVFAAGHGWDNYRIELHDRPESVNMRYHFEAWHVDDPSDRIVGEGAADIQSAAGQLDRKKLKKRPSPDAPAEPQAPTSWPIVTP